METPEEERHDYDPAPESETPEGAAEHQGATSPESADGGDASDDDTAEGLDSQQGDQAGGDADGTERVPEADQD